MKLSKLARRNLWRRKRRTLITGFSIGFGVMLAVTFTGAGDYTYTNMINTGATMGLGHITIEPAGYNQTPTLDKRLSTTDALRTAVLALPEVDNAYVRIFGQAMFATATKSIGGMFIAIDPTVENSQHNLLIRSLQEGQLFTSKDSRQVVIGSKMAQKLNLHLGKKLVYTTTDANGEIVSEIARVSGIFSTGVHEIDGAMVLLPIDKVRHTLNYTNDEASVVAINIRDQRYSAAIRDKIAAQFDQPQREILTWRETQPELVGVINMDKSGNYVSQVLVGLLIAAGILNTMLMSVLERSREFGVMMAVGMSPLTLFRLVIVESFWLSILGLILGIIITAPWYAYLHNVGIDFSTALGEEYSAGGVLIDPVMKIRLYKESVIWILSGVFSLTIMASLYPAWRAVTIAPVESLKNI